MNKLTQEVRTKRIEDAHRFNVGWAGKTTTVVVGISRKTIDDFGYDLSDSPLLDANKGTGYFVVNSCCPVATSLEEAEEIAKILLPNSKDLLDVVNAKFATEFQNKSRAILNQQAESKKAVKLSTAAELKAAFDAGEIDGAELFSRMQALL